jgi:hypothetical protein
VTLTVCRADFVTSCKMHVAWWGQRYLPTDITVKYKYCTCTELENPVLYVLSQLLVQDLVLSEMDLIVCIRYNCIYTDSVTIIVIRRCKVQGVWNTSIQLI